MDFRLFDEVLYAGPIGGGELFGSGSKLSDV